MIVNLMVELDFFNKRTLDRIGMFNFGASTAIQLLNHFCYLRSFVCC